MSALVSNPDEPFSDVIMKRLARVAGIASDPERIARLHEHLLPIGIYYRRVIATTPSELKSAPRSDNLTQRRDWMDSNVLNPLAKLLAALEPEWRSMFSMWPEEVDEKLMPDFDRVKRELDHLHLLASNAIIVIVKYRFHDLPIGQLIRYRIVASAADAVAKALPDMKPSRGTYDKETKGFNGPYPDLIRAIYKEITGEDEQLDRLIKEQVDARRT